MIDPSSIERAGAYLTLHLTHTGPGGAASAVGPFVTISREAGTGGSALAHALCQRLQPIRAEHPWAVYSANLIEEMLRTNNLPPHLARFLPEDRIHEFDASVGELVGLHPNLWDLVAKTNELIRRLARAGNAIILGRGANCATADILHGVHVRVVGSAAFRAARTATRFGLDTADAVARNAACDAARRRYVRATFDSDVSSPTNYDIVLDAERLSLGTMVDIISFLVESQTGEHAAKPRLASDAPHAVQYN